MYADRLYVAPYYGGKAWHAGWIVGLLPVRPRWYIELFGGSAAVLLNRVPLGPYRAEIYNDLDGRICNLMRWIRDDDKWPRLRRRIEWTLHCRATHAEALAVTTEDGLEAAWATFVDLTQSFSGVRGSDWRMASAGSQSQSAIRSPVLSVERLGAAKERLHQVSIENRPWQDLARKHDDPDALYYLDPPYLPSARRQTSRYVCEMTEDGHRELLAWMAGTPAAVAVSGYASPLYDDALAGWTRTARETCAFAGTSAAAAPARRTEVLWRNGRCMDMKRSEAPDLFG